MGKRMETWALLVLNVCSCCLESPSPFSSEIDYSHFWHPTAVCFILICFYFSTVAPWYPYLLPFSYSSRERLRGKKKKSLMSSPFESSQFLFPKSDAADMTHVDPLCRLIRSTDTSGPAHCSETQEQVSCPMEAPKFSSTGQKMPFTCMAYWHTVLCWLSSPRTWFWRRDSALPIS